MGVSETNILLASSGRRPYLAEWFARARDRYGHHGNVVVADADPHAAAQAHADVFLVAPRITEPHYRTWLLEILERYKISLALSVNDYELSEWAEFHGDPAFEALVTLDSHTQGIVADKLTMASHLESLGIRTPATRLAADWHRNPFRSRGSSYVVKGRFGSGSRGLRMADWCDVKEAISRCGSEVTDKMGGLAETSALAESLIIVQEKIDGVEYGIDVIADLNANYQTVLARKKIVMRSGETDQATTVAPGRFIELGEALSRALPHRGSVDVDVIVDHEDCMWVIDVNPRMGGGYPFSHAAGADIPAAYFAWTTGRSADPNWLTTEAAVTSVKHVGITTLNKKGGS